MEYKRKISKVGDFNEKFKGTTLISIYIKVIRQQYEELYRWTHGKENPHFCRKTKN